MVFKDIEIHYQRIFYKVCLLTHFFFDLKMIVYVCTSVLSLKILKIEYWCLLFHKMCFVSYFVGHFFPTVDGNLVGYRIKKQTSSITISQFLFLTATNFASGQTFYILITNFFVLMLQSNASAWSEAQSQSFDLDSNKENLLKICHKQSKD